MKWAGMYFIGFVVLLGGVMAALWKLGILASVDPELSVLGPVGFWLANSMGPQFALALAVLFFAQALLLEVFLPGLAAVS